jgi:hypothetical protein
MPRIHDAELARLFAELRKLRPGAAVGDGAGRGSAAPQAEASLDGALCTAPPRPPAVSTASARPRRWSRVGAAPIAPEGRECWMEIDAAGDRVAAATALPPGWGVVLRGALSAVSVAALRQSYPLRAWGMRFERREDRAPGARRCAPLGLWRCSEGTRAREGPEPRGILGHVVSRNRCGRATSSRDELFRRARRPRGDQCGMGMPSVDCRTDGAGLCVPARGPRARRRVEPRDRSNLLAGG